jgi:hypothetical protein
MKNRGRFALLVGALCMLMISCMLPGMIPLNKVSEGPRPYMETDPEKVLEALRGGQVLALEALAPERYTEEDLAKPGRLTYTVTISDDLPTILMYGWCAVDEQILQQNFEHIVVKIYFNDEELGNDVVHGITYVSPQNNMPCQAYSVLMSEWPEGTYTLEAVATFDDEINDGVANYAAGDYAFIYNVTVEKIKEGATAPSG